MNAPMAVCLYFAILPASTAIVPSAPRAMFVIRFVAVLVSSPPVILAAGSVVTGSAFVTLLDAVLTDYAVLGSWWLPASLLVYLPPYMIAVVSLGT